MKRLLYTGAFCSLAWFVVVVNVAAADISISEIMYDVPGTDAGYEWVEVHNTSAAAIDMANWRFLENDVRHALSLEAGPSAMVMPGEYAIIASNSASFLEAHVGFVGVLFDSVFSLNNTGESIALVAADDTTQDTVFYTPQDAANGTGNSLQYVGSSWVAAAETPGLTNHTSPVETGDTGTSGSGSSNSGSVSSGSNKKPKETFKPYYAMTLEAPDIMLAGVTFELDAELQHFRPNRKPIIKHAGRFVWSMGDGATYTQEWEEPLGHQYQYPGEYIVHLEYFKSDLFQEPNSTVQKKIVVHGPQVAFGEVTGGGDIRLDSSSSFTFDLSGWSLRYRDDVFIFPPHTYVPANESRYIPALVHGLAGLGPQSSSPLVLVRPSGEVHLEVVARDLLKEKVIPAEDQKEEGEAEPGPDVVAEAMLDTLGEVDPLKTSNQAKEAPEKLMWALLGVGMLSSLVTLGGLWWSRKREEAVVGELVAGE